MGLLKLKYACRPVSGVYVVLVLCQCLSVSFLLLLLYLYCWISLQLAYSCTEWIHNSRPPQYWEAGVQCSANSKEVESYLNGHMKEVE